MNNYYPDYAIHPGEYLEEVLEAREIKKADFAKRAGITPKAVSQIVGGKALYSAELAYDFERILGVKAEIWVNMANAWQLFQVKAKEEARMDSEVTRNWLRRFPVADLRKLGIVPSSRKPHEVAEAILRFFNVSSPEACTEWLGQRAVAFRKSYAFTESVEATSIWIRLAEREAASLDLSPFQREPFRSLLGSIRPLTLLPPQRAIEELKKACAGAGLALVIIPKLQGIRLSGASWWFGNDRPVIALSLRYRTNDHFWFTFCHEAAHILLHGKKGIYLDSVEPSESPEEREADAFAQNCEIPAKEWDRFVTEANFYQSTIQAFAARIGIHAGIVVGRLQHEGRIEKSWHNGLKVSMEGDINAD